jgi:cytochrome c oxidase subunit 4
MAHDHPKKAEHDAPHEAATPRRTYIFVWIALLVLTFATTAIAKIDMGPFNVYVALTIAVVKAMLVILFFMHVNHTHGITRVYVAAGFFWLMILVGLTLTDYLSRHWLPPDRAW